MKIKRSVIHEEFLLHIYRGGIQLIRPHKNKNTPKNRSQQNKNMIVDNILKFPFNVYFLNTDNAVLNMSEENAKLIGCESIKEAIGKTIFNFAHNEQDAFITVKNNLTVMKTELTQTTIESVLYNNGNYCSSISIKSPWYDLDGNIIGILGFSIPLEVDNFSSYFAQITELGLLIPAKYNAPKYLVPSKSVVINNLTDREIEVLYHLIRGKTLKNIATFLAISPRTVEQHLDNIKQKLNVSSKADLIEKTIDIFFTDI